MATEIKVDLNGSKEITLNTRRVFLTMEINAKDEFIKVFYTEEIFYTEDSEDIVTSSEVKSYNADFKNWKAGATGIAITTALETELAKEVPGYVAPIEE